jgi:hypothetical protein
MLAFDPITHTYTEDGRKIPGVTSVLQRAGLVDYSHIPESIREASLNRGTVVHAICALDAVNNLYEPSVHDDVKGYLAAFRKFKKDMIAEVIGVERKLISLKYHYAGTSDLFAVTHKGQRAVVDYKTAETFCPANDIQLIAYMKMEQESGQKVNERFSVLLNSDGEYKVYPCKNSASHDFNIFLSALSIYNWKEINL